MNRAIGGHSNQQILADKRIFRRKVLKQKVSLIATAADAGKIHDLSAKLVGVLLLYVISKTDSPFEVRKLL